MIEYKERESISRIIMHDLRHFFDDIEHKFRKYTTLGGRVQESDLQGT